MVEIKYNPIDKLNNNTPNFSDSLIEHTSKLPVRFRVGLDEVVTNAPFASDGFDIVVDSVFRLKDEDGLYMSRVHLEGLVDERDYMVNIDLKPFIQSIADKWVVSDVSVLTHPNEFYIDINPVTFVLSFHGTLQNLSTIELFIMWGHGGHVPN